jgi:endonuclease-3 related protein
VPSRNDTARLRRIAASLDQAYGGEHWHWAPEHVRGPMDIVAGAILVQHTTWQSAERALALLRDATALDPETISRMDDAALLPLIAVSGTPAVKARRLRAVMRTILDAGGVDAFFALPDDDMRSRLIATHGVGDETADAILLYAAGRRSFVIDAYTRRTFGRLGITPSAGDRYADWQRMFEDALPAADAAVFQRCHANIVLHAKAVCRAQPRCAECLLRLECASALLHVTA